MYLSNPVYMLTFLSYLQPVRRRVSMAGEMVATRTVNKIDEQSSSKSNTSSYRGGDGSSANDDDVIQSYYRYYL